MAAVHAPSFPSDATRSYMRPSSRDLVGELRAKRRLGWSKQLSEDLDHQERGAEVLLKHEEEVGLRIARNARDTASCMLKHEQELQRVVLKYEGQLNMAMEAQRGGALERHLQNALQAEKRRYEDAESARAVAEEALAVAKAQATKYRRRLQKLKTQGPSEVERSEEARPAQNVQDIHEVGVTTTSKSGLFEFQEKVVTTRVQCAEHILMSIALRGWAECVADTQHEMVLQAELERVSLQATAALSNLRVDVRSLRSQRQRIGRKALSRQMLLCQASAFGAWARFTAATRPAARLAVVAAAPRLAAAQSAPAQGALAAKARACAADVLASSTARHLVLRVLMHWAMHARRCAADARHAFSLETQLEEATMHCTNALACARAELRQARRRAFHVACREVAVRARAAMAAPFAAWSRTALQAKATRSAGAAAPAAELSPRREVVLNSGEAARRAARQLEEERALYSERLEAAQRKAKQAEVSKEAVHTLGQTFQVKVLQMLVCRSWAVAVRMSRMELAVTEREAEVRKLEKQAEEASSKHKVEIACARGEAKRALHEAWDAAAEASRRAARLECRRQPSQLTHILPTPSGGADVGSQRPRTALGIEQELARRQALARGLDPPGEAGYTMQSPPEVLRLEVVRDSGGTIGDDLVNTTEAS